MTNLYKKHERLILLWFCLWYFLATLTMCMTQGCSGKQRPATWVDDLTAWEYFEQDNSYSYSEQIPQEAGEGYLALLDNYILEEEL